MHASGEREGINARCFFGEWSGWGAGAGASQATAALLHTRAHESVEYIAGILGRRAAGFSYKVLTLGIHCWRGYEGLPRG
jgi:hypothetical protein